MNKEEAFDAMVEYRIQLGYRKDKITAYFQAEGQESYVSVVMVDFGYDVSLASIGVVEKAVRKIKEGY